MVKNILYYTLCSWRLKIDKADVYHPADLGELLEK